MLANYIVAKESSQYFVLGTQLTNKQPIFSQNVDFKKKKTNEGSLMARWKKIFE